VPHRARNDFSGWLDDASYQFDVGFVAYDDVCGFDFLPSFRRHVRKGTRSDADDAYSPSAMATVTLFIFIFFKINFE
jgi:hypothetical protein